MAKAKAGYVCQLVKRPFVSFLMESSEYESYEACDVPQKLQSEAR